MNLIDLLLESSKQLIEEVKMLNYEKINEKPALDKWSISQICHHLYCQKNYLLML